MVRLELDITKSLEENANDYFEQAKKLRKKAEGAKKAIAVYEDKKAKQLLQQEKADADQQGNAPVKKRTPQWYEKFRWFISSEGFLIIGGRDATTNEMIIKKFTEKHDVVFHTDMAGSPFFVVKTNGKKPGQQTLQEVANATFIFSRAFKLGLGTTSVFYVLPGQVSKEPNPGEYLPKGAFVIRGKTTYLPPSFDLAVGVTEHGAVMAGPASAVKKNCAKQVTLFPGKEKTSDVAKKIKKALGTHDLDEVIRALPPGSVRIKG
ncbi:DUF814 domain-containing protein [Candidatus Woesearchaeota archaeon]|nr:DUF814 domain-containing protein [Candidatus Woesearchaeota archaeon]